MKKIALFLTILLNFAINVDSLQSFALSIDLPDDLGDLLAQLVIARTELRESRGDYAQALKRFDKGAMNDAKAREEDAERRIAAINQTLADSQIQVVDQSQAQQVQSVVDKPLEE